MRHFEPSGLRGKSAASNTCARSAGLLPAARSERPSRNIPSAPGFGLIDLLRYAAIFSMDFDISHLLDQWDYQPGQVVVRRFKAKDGREKIQLRVDLGLLQMNAEGRPDGKRPFGQPSLFEYYRARLHKYVAAHAGSDEGFKLKPEDCARLQLEALQYHHRYICLLQLEDHSRRNPRRRTQPGGLRLCQPARRERGIGLVVAAVSAAASDGAHPRPRRPRRCRPMTTPWRFSRSRRAWRRFAPFATSMRAAEAAENRAPKCSRWKAGSRKSAPNARCPAAKSWSGPCTMPINSEDYERAAKVRDELRNLKPAE